MRRGVGGSRQTTWRVRWVSLPRFSTVWWLAWFVFITGYMMYERVLPDDLARVQAQWNANLQELKAENLALQKALTLKPKVIPFP